MHLNDFIKFLSPQTNKLTRATNPDVIERRWGNAEVEVMRVLHKPHKLPWPRHQTGHLNASSHTTDATRSFQLLCNIT